jgi:hypothetical protein
MRKLLILLLVAAAIGILISQRRTASAPLAEPGAASAGADVASASGTRAPAPAQPAAEPAAKPLQTRADDQPAERLSVAAGPGPSRHEAKQVPSALSEIPKALVLAAMAPAEPSRTGQTALAAAPAEPTRTGQTALPAAPASSAGKSVPADLKRALSLVDAGKWLEARAILSDLYLGSRGEPARQVREVLDRINQKLVFDPRCLEGAQVHVVDRGDSLVKIGKKYGVNWRMIARINGMQADKIRGGQKLKILTGRTSAVVYKTEFRLALLLDGVYVKEYRVGVGKNDLTPAGQMTVASMMVRPDWYPPEGGVIKYGQPGYQLGERWIAFANEPGASGLGIHGTSDESSIGTKCSNGCIRLKNEDVIELYDFMQLGSRVEVKE